MDDTKAIDAATYKLTIAGDEYEFGQPDPELLGRMVLINHMNAGGFLTLEAVTKWLASGAGERVWAAIMKRFLDGTVSAQDLITAMNELVTLVVEKQGATSDAA